MTGSEYMCNLSNRWARRHRRDDVMTSWYKSMCSLHRTQKALFDERGAFTSVPRGTGLAAAETEWRRHLWGSQLDLREGLETSESLSLSSPTPITASRDRKPALRILSLGQRAWHFSYLPPRRLMWRASRMFCPLIRPNMSSSWGLSLVLWPN